MGIFSQSIGKIKLCLFDENVAAIVEGGIICSAKQDVLTQSAILNPRLLRAHRKRTSRDHAASKARNVADEG